ncbi:hypothetical protein MM213_14590 [Belliella sp. R4-6]|uniref:Outer membrane protein beta-barrel domain-containing protein n=1 Tax=Belliella alkalica TaxID=1730871 RepID=A0ABS9VE54_9BACT|nr:hypothetical protein [Belliella alkalica]MCH7414725.1 hypothetical protein [Belliella alkalica]
MFKKVFFISLVLLAIVSSRSFSQSALRPTFAGVYHSGLKGQVGIGTDIDQKYFGEIRFGANDVLETSFGIEGLFNRNIYKDEWFNFHAGLMLGYYFYDEFRIGIPLGFTIKPIENHRNFAVLMEATPNTFGGSRYTNLRASIGVRYTFRK